MEINIFCGIFVLIVLKIDIILYYIISRAELFYYVIGCLKCVWVKDTILHLYTVCNDKYVCNVCSFMRTDLFSAGFLQVCHFISFVILFLDHRCNFGGFSMKKINKFAFLFILSSPNFSSFSVLVIDERVPNPLRQPTGDHLSDDCDRYVLSGFSNIWCIYVQLWGLLYLFLSLDILVSGNR